MEHISLHYKTVTQSPTYDVRTHVQPTTTPSHVGLLALIETKYFMLNKFNVLFSIHPRIHREHIVHATEPDDGHHLMRIAWQKI